MLDTNQKLYFMDFAGFFDTSGALVELLNSLIAKMIFQNADGVKFLVPITHDQMTLSRGKDVK